MCKEEEQKQCQDWKCKNWPQRGKKEREEQSVLAKLSVYGNMVDISLILPSDIITLNQFRVVILPLHFMDVNLQNLFRDF